MSEQTKQPKSDYEGDFTFYEDDSDEDEQMLLKRIQMRRNRQHHLAYGVPGAAAASVLQRGRRKTLVGAQQIGLNMHVANLPGMAGLQAHLEESRKDSMMYEAKNLNDKDYHQKLIQEQRKQKFLETAGTLRKHLYNLTESTAFNGFILAVILINTVILCMLTFDSVAVRAGWYFTFLDYIFLVIYLMECILKIFVWRLDYFKEKWNLMDFVIVTINMLDYGITTILGNDVNILNVLGMFRALRALRALRVLRTVRFFRSLQVIMNTCAESVQSMGAITMVIVLFLYMFAVIGRGLYGEVDEKRFGSLGAAMLTLFQLLTLDDWFYIYTDAIKKDPGNFHIIFYLIMYIVVEYFIFLNLFVAVLVDNFQLTLEAANEKEISKKKAEKEDPGTSGFDLTNFKLQQNSFGSLSLDGPKEKRAVEHYYTDEKYTTSDKQYLTHFFRLLAALEYNGHTLRNQHGTLDKMIEIVQETVDDA